MRKFECQEGHEKCVKNEESMMKMQKGREKMRHRHEQPGGQIVREIRRRDEVKTKFKGWSLEGEVVTPE